MGLRMSIKKQGNQKQKWKPGNVNLSYKIHHNNQGSHTSFHSSVLSLPTRLFSQDEEEWYK